MLIKSKHSFAIICFIIQVTHKLYDTYPPTVYSKSNYLTALQNSVHALNKRKSIYKRLHLEGLINIVVIKMFKCWLTQELNLFAAVLFY